QALLTGNGGVGGGILAFGPSMATASTSNGNARPQIHNSVISGNQAGSLGGGCYCTAGLVIDQGTVFSNNTGGIANAINSVNGGGMWLALSPNCCGSGLSGVPDVMDITKTTFSGNSAPHGSGGGI